MYLYGISGLVLYSYEYINFINCCSLHCCISTVWKYAALCELFWHLNHPPFLKYHTYCITWVTDLITTLPYFVHTPLLWTTTLNVQFRHCVVAPTSDETTQAVEVCPCTTVKIWVNKLSSNLKSAHYTYTYHFRSPESMKVCKSMRLRDKIYYTGHGDSMSVP